MSYLGQKVVLLSVYCLDGVVNVTREVGVIDRELPDEFQPRISVRFDRVGAAVGTGMLAPNDLITNSDEQPHERATFVWCVPDQVERLERVMRERIAAACLRHARANLFAAMAAVPRWITSSRVADANHALRGLLYDLKDPATMDEVRRDVELLRQYADAGGPTGIPEVDNPKPHVVEHFDLHSVSLVKGEGDIGIRGLTPVLDELQLSVYDVRALQSRRMVSIMHHGRSIWVAGDWFKELVPKGTVLLSLTDSEVASLVRGGRYSFESQGIALIGPRVDRTVRLPRSAVETLKKGGFWDMVDTGEVHACLRFIPPGVVPANIPPQPTVMNVALDSFEVGILSRGGDVRVPPHGLLIVGVYLD